MSIRPAAQESSKRDRVPTTRMRLPSIVESEESLSAIETSSYAIFISIASMLTLYVFEIAGRDIPLLTKLPGS
jgi:hypothetical protein